VIAMRERGGFEISNVPKSLPFLKVSGEKLGNWGKKGEVQGKKRKGKGSKGNSFSTTRRCLTSIPTKVATDGAKRKKAQHGMNVTRGEGQKRPESPGS